MAGPFQSLSGLPTPLAATSGKGPKGMRLRAPPHHFGPIPGSGPWENPKRNYGEGFLGTGLIPYHLFPSLHCPESCIPHITGG